MISLSLGFLSWEMGAKYIHVWLGTDLRTQILYLSFLLTLFPSLGQGHAIQREDRCIYLCNVSRCQPGPSLCPPQNLHERKSISQGLVSSWVPQVQLNLLGAPGLAWGWGQPREPHLQGQLFLNRQGAGFRLQRGHRLKSEGSRLGSGPRQKPLLPVVRGQ